MDWGDGQYELTADLLAPVSDRVVEVAGISAGERVLDVATGTGNCALAAAGRGAQVTGVDPAERLLGVAASRPGGAAITWRQGEGTQLPVADDSFDAVTSVFGVIFVPDAPAAIAELVRATVPGGRVVITTWTSDGALAASGYLMRQAVTAAQSGLDGGPPPSNWTDPDLVTGLFATHGAAVTVNLEQLTLTHRSAAAWFDEQEQHHPAWRAGRAVVDDATWADVRRRSLELLEAANTDPLAMSVSSGYRVFRADLPG